MKYLIPDFKKLDNGDIPRIVYHRVNCHMIFDDKMKYLRRKARLVAGGNTAELPSTITYASVVSRETVRIALTLYFLDDFPVKIADI